MQRRNAPRNWKNNNVHSNQQIVPSCHLDVIIYMSQDEILLHIKFSAFLGILTPLDDRMSEQGKNYPLLMR